LIALQVPVSPGRSTRAVKQRLRELSSRFRGATAVTMRQDPVPWAYRVFYRHIGLDPDRTRTPIEGAAVERLLRGEFKAQNRVDDALTISLVETGVPIWALDAGMLDGELGLRPARSGERLGRGEETSAVVAGRLVVADAQSPVGELFGELAPGHGVHSQSREAMLFAVRVPGVPDIHVEEALWTCAELLRAT
jgi:DNA/RNA-binding domain of Phe-tRNA-synthetase-like protein